jgi:hypothetical protein
MGKSKSNVIPENAVEVSIEDVIAEYAAEMTDEQLSEMAEQMGIENVGLPELSRIATAQAWVINDLLEGPLSGVKFYRDIDPGLH